MIMPNRLLNRHYSIPKQKHLHMLLHQKLLENLKAIPLTQNQGQFIAHGTPTKWPEEINMETDGASRGNPGPAGTGLLVLNTEKQEIYSESFFLGHSYTNNVAEYSAVFRALYLAVKNKATHVTLKSDSQFLVRQLRGQYKVKSKNIMPLYLACQELIKQIPKIDIQHVHREFNRRADLIANLILDKVTTLL